MLDTHASASALSVTSKGKKRLTAGDRLAIVSREKRVFDWLLKGWTLTDIAEKEQIAYQVVQRIRNRVIERYERELGEDARRVTVRQVGQCQMIQREALAAWEKSKSAKVRQKRKQSPAVDGTPGALTEENTLENQVGNPVYLHLAISAMKREAELVGADAPLKVAPTSPDGLRPWNPETDTAIRARMLELLARAQTQAIDVTPSSVV